LDPPVSGDGFGPTSGGQGQVMDDDAIGTGPGAPPVAERRRFARFGDTVGVPTLFDQSLRSAELQLQEARESLKDARRRVVQLEDAVEGWRALRNEMVRHDSVARRAAAN
jgi:hypothetical protein